MTLLPRISSYTYKIKFDKNLQVTIKYTSNNVEPSFNYCLFGMKIKFKPP